MNHAIQCEKELLWKTNYIFVKGIKSLSDQDLLGRRQANLCFHFAESGENLLDIAKSRDATLDNKLLVLSSKYLMKQNYFLF